MTENFDIDTDLDRSKQGSTSASPFGDELIGEPYTDEFRKLSLNKLLHLAPYSEVLLVSGAKDIGKSTLLQQFVSRAAESWRVAFVKATPVMTARALLIQIAQALGLTFNDSDSQDDLLWEIIRHLQALGRSGRRAILVIDDAHLLLAEVLSLVEDILEDERSLNAMSVVLAVDGEHESRLRSFPVLQDRLAYTLRFEPLSQDGVDEYIRHRLLQVDDMDAIDHFSTGVVEEIYEQSRGLPGQINALARLQLAEANAKKKSSGRRSVMRWGMAVASVAVVAAALVFQDKINRMFEMPLALDESDIIVSENSRQNSGDVVALATNQLPSDGMEKRDSGEVVAVKNDEANARPTPDAQRVAELPPGVEVHTVNDDVSVTESGGTELPKNTAKTRIAVKESPAEKVDVTQTTAAISEKSGIENGTKAKAPKPASREAKAQPQNWLMTQSPTHFTLQLMALQDAQKVKQFIKQHGLSDESGTFRINRKGKTLTVLVYGSYGTRNDAERAAQKLPKTWGVSEPWIRSFESVQQLVIR